MSEIWIPVIVAILATIPGIYALVSQQKKDYSEIRNLESQITERVLKSARLEIDTLKLEIEALHIEVNALKAENKDISEVYEKAMDLLKDENRLLKEENKQLRTELLEVRADLARVNAYRERDSELLSSLRDRIRELEKSSNGG